MASADCPSRTELSEFVVGKVSRSLLARVADHVVDCDACEATLRELESVGDPLLRRLHRLTFEQPHIVPPVPAELVEAARSLGRDATPPQGPRADCPGRLGKFELLEELGLGSFGSVFRARDTELDRTVAVKILRAGRLACRADVDRFLREARSAAQLKHPGIVSLFESGQTEDGTCYLVEEFVHGMTLAERLRRDTVSFSQAVELIIQVAEALDYAHQHGVIHRDIKPSNILIDSEGEAHLMDFGLAKRESDEEPMTLEGEVLGTPAYMSPEQARGESHQVDARSDLYSLGVILYELLSGERPFRGNRRMLILQVIEDEPRRVSQLNDRIPSDLETICLKAMAKSPSRRYTTAGDLAEDLRRFVRGEPIRARPVGAAERLWRWCRRNPVPASLFVAVSVGSASGLLYLSRLSEHLVRSTALESASQHAQMLDVVNNLYSAEVVDRVTPEGIHATPDYATRRGAIPLPATFTIDLGTELGKCDTGVQVRLYSDYPFRSRDDGGPRDDFEHEALARLRSKPNEPVYRFEDFLGRSSLRYATARRMQESCVHCHNTHPDSTKTDWKVGDVRGVLEIIRPLDQDIGRTRDGLRGAFILVAAVSASLLALSIGVLVVGSRR